MSATELVIQQIVKTGMNPTLEDVNADGHYFRNDGRCYIRLQNGGTAKTMTVLTHKTVGGDLVVENREIAIASAQDDVSVGPLDPGTYNDANGYAWLEFDSVVNLKIGVRRL